MSNDILGKFTEGLKHLGLEEAIRYLPIGVVDVALLIIGSGDNRHCMQGVGKVLSNDIILLLAVPTLGVVHYAFHRCLFIVLDGASYVMNLAPWSECGVPGRVGWWKAGWTKKATFVLWRHSGPAPQKEVDELKWGQKENKKLSEYFYLQWALTHTAFMVVESVVVFLLVRRPGCGGLPWWVWLILCVFATSVFGYKAMELHYFEKRWYKESQEKIK